MTNTAITKTFQMPDGVEISIETGRLAKQADGSAVVKMGDTMILATIVSKKEAGENVDFLPLSVDYQEKYAAFGRFPGGFFKREARLSEHEIIIARLVDRAIRPLFPNDFHAEIQVAISLISSDRETAPVALACLAASSAIMVSDLPFNGPISEVQIGRINGQYIINPAISKMGESDMEITVAASADNILMVEGEMKEVSENDMIEAIKKAHEAIKIQCQAQVELAQMVEKAAVKREYCHEVHDPELKEIMKTTLYDKIYHTAKQGNPDKHKRREAFDAIREEFVMTLPEEKREEKKNIIDRYYHDLEKEAVRAAILNERIRLDGRKMDEIRPIWCEVNYLPGAHGSAIFTRGETQSLTTCTMGTKLDEQIIDGVVFEGKNNFLLHYNFPGFSTGEVKPNRGPARREIGHGNLAMRALKNMLPTGKDNPYTIRIVSDILESNGSSSMATVCAGTLALMDTGVKIKRPVSGIAMGLITDETTGKYAVLSDILGDEDHLGDMDFKVCGTTEGITACQMDIKVNGLSYEILAEALDQAKRGRQHILGKILETLPEPRADYKPNVPRIIQMIIDRQFIGAVIGPGGKIIQEMQRETNSTIVIEEVGDHGVIDIASSNLDSIEEVKRRILKITGRPEVGEIYKGVVKGITTYGAFVEIMPDRDGLLHISEIDWKHIKDVASIFKVGDEIEVKLIDIDANGKMKLSRKILLPKPEGFDNKEKS
ncbi:MAG: polyribonucleotide nucleotidyltransferase [Bacteroidetes bacterium]|nr:polyribonucleotide nucleotidyltransferase [Bacteroidota bacterium]